MTARRTAPDVSIIICTYTRAELLRKTLRSLAHVFDIEQAEVIVVDNRSVDHTAEVVQACMAELRGKVNMRYVFEPCQGLSIARNTGMDEAAAPIIAFLDDDAVPMMNWLHSLKRTFANDPDVGAAGGIIHPDFETGRPPWLIPPLEYPYAIINLGDRERWFPRKLYPFGANMAVRRAAIGDLSFPEHLGRKGGSLLSGEETWFFGQLRRKGWKLRYQPGMQVRHHIAADRLHEAWIRKRYYYQGVSVAMERATMTDEIRIVSKMMLRFAYTAIHSLFAWTPGQRLLAACRRESIRGTMRTLRGKDAEPSYE